MHWKFLTTMGAVALIVLLGGVSNAAQDIPASWPFDHWTSDGRAFKEGEHVGWIELNDAGRPKIVENEAGQSGLSFTKINPSGSVAVNNVAGKPREIRATDSLQTGVTKQSVGIHEISAETNVNWGTVVEGHMDGSAFNKAVDLQLGLNPAGSGGDTGSKNCVLQYPPSHMAAMVNAVNNGGDQETLEKILRDSNVSGLDSIGMAEALSAQIRAGMVAGFNRTQLAMVLLRGFLQNKVCGTGVTTATAMNAPLPAQAPKGSAASSSGAASNPVHFPLDEFLRGINKPVESTTSGNTPATGATGAANPPSSTTPAGAAGAANPPSGPIRATGPQTAS